MRTLTVAEGGGGDWGCSVVWRGVDREAVRRETATTRRCREMWTRGGLKRLRLLSDGSLDREAVQRGKLGLLESVERCGWTSQWFEKTKTAQR